MNRIINYIMGGNIKPDKKSLDILTAMSKQEGIRSIIVLPDIHYKHSYHTPTGVAVFTEDKIFPKFVNPNCGISFIAIPFKRKDLTNKQIDEIFNFLQKEITVATRLKPNISLEELKSILLKGAEPVYNKYGLDKTCLKNIENKGNIFSGRNKTIQKIISALPKEAIEMGMRSFGVLGYGNHFLEMQRVKKILNPQTARKFGLEKDQLCIMLHSDSRAFG
ncbi:MAG: RtcB family protein, partial [Candidatus Woesearchaeota archaeon]|nr:RtcB family protein [Candidatus Woesearchaeota archaeon]